MADTLEWVTLALFMFSLSAESPSIFLLLFSAAVATLLIGHRYYGTWRLQGSK